MIDTQQLVAQRYGMINVPTVVWIDERGALVRSNAIEYGSDMFSGFHGRKSGPFLAAVRAWVSDGVTPEQVPVLWPNDDEQRARGLFALVLWLHEQGHAEAAVALLQDAAALAPHDWTIRRAGLPIAGQDPMMSEAFMALMMEWAEAGRPGYREHANARKGSTAP